MTIKPDCTPESTLETILAEVHRRGFRLHNLFEHDAKVFPLHWQANLASASKECWEFGSGETAGHALWAALIRAMNDQSKALREDGTERGPQALQVVSVGLSLDDLGL